LGTSETANALKTQKRVGLKHWVEERRGGNWVKSRSGGRKRLRSKQGRIFFPKVTKRSREEDAICTPKGETEENIAPKEGGEPGEKGKR